MSSFFLELSTGFFHHFQITTTATRAITPNRIHDVVENEEKENILS